MKAQNTDQYIELSADFAKPILNHLRTLVHQVCPEVEENKITEAKMADTRAKRIGTTVEWVAEGKTRNWKYK